MADLRKGTRTQGHADTKAPGTTAQVGVSQECKVRFLPDGGEAIVPAGTTLLAAAAAAHVAIDAPCGDRGICGKCRVQLVSPSPRGEVAYPSSFPAAERPSPSPSAPGDARSGDGTDPEREGWRCMLEPPTLPERSLLTAEELHRGWRLACQARLRGDAVVRVPDRTLKPAVVPLSKIEPRPFVRKLHISLPEPTLEDPASDLTRLRRALSAAAPDLELELQTLQQLPATLLAGRYDVTAVVAGGRLLALEPGDTATTGFGIAVDLGTTSVVVALAELSTGRILGIESRLNQQANHGADVVSRITYATQPDGLRALQSAAVDTINDALAALVEKTGVEPRRIYEAVVVGNSCMSHLLLGVDPRSLALAPYQPVVVDPVSCKAAEIGLAINPAGSVYTLPNIAGFVGSDTVAVILATGMHRSREVRLAIDLGTNGEIVLGNREVLLACSTAAGPAFEGARISSGMRATEGAIERVWIDGGEVRLQVIGNRPAIGLCGSGLLDAVAQMLSAGILDESGRLAVLGQDEPALPSGLRERIVRSDGTGGFVLAQRGRRRVMLTQLDVRELQLAKGAIRAGISILLKELALGESDIDEILLAGAFGSFINPASARSIGLVPPIPLQRITAVGNAAGQGALMALLSTDLRQEASSIARSVRYVELSGRSDFMEQFMEDMLLTGPRC